MPFLAVGSLGKTQLDALAKLLKETWRSRLSPGHSESIIHPFPEPLNGANGWLTARPFLTSSAAMELNWCCMATLILANLREIQHSRRQDLGCRGPIQLGAESPRGTLRQVQSLPDKTKRPNWDLTLFVRGYSEKTGKFVEEQEIALSLPHFQPGKRLQMGS